MNFFKKSQTSSTFMNVGQGFFYFSNESTGKVVSKKYPAQHSVLFQYSSIAHADKKKKYEGMEP